MKIKAIRVNSKDFEKIIQVKDIRSVQTININDHESNMSYPALHICYVNEECCEGEHTLYFNSIEERDAYKETIYEGFDFIDLPIRQKNVL